MSAADPTATLAGNVPEYTVSEISGAVKRTLEGAFGRVRVRGELTEVKPYPSGHIYLSLKDEGGKLNGVIWRSAVRGLGLKPENGVEVIATGKLSAYADRSNYQLVIERLEYAGVGALLARIEALRERLLAEGLFAPERKKPLRVLPSLVGVVTSAQGAVLQDIRTTIARRFPRDILLWPVPVQGEGAAEKIAAAIAGMSALPAHGPGPRRPDVLIVARGGGSLEDLMAFNDEAVVRAAAACPIPLISAVGHETDTTLLDFAADRRAPTPTAAAELAVPLHAELSAAVANAGARLAAAVQAVRDRRQLALSQAERRLPDLPSLVNQARQRLDDRSLRLTQAVPARLSQAASDVAALRQRLGQALPLLASRGRTALMSAGQPLAALRQALSVRQTAAARVLPKMTETPLRARLREARARLTGLANLLEAVSHRSVLARGYALVTSDAGAPITAAAAVTAGALLHLRFADGSVTARAEPGSLLPPAEAAADRLANGPRRPVKSPRG